MGNCCDCQRRIPRPSTDLFSESDGLLLLPHPETEDPCLSLEEISREPVKLHINIASEPVTHDVRRMDGL